jgi:hypothetical protein
MQQPSIEVLAEIAYERFLVSLGDYRPPFAKPWADIPAIVQHSWMRAIEAALEKIGNA